MNKFLNQIVVVALVAALTGCGATQPVAEDELTVLATATFLADIAQNVAGDRVTVSSLLPFGADPHTYEPTPSDIGRVAAADVFIANGAGFETYLTELLANAGGDCVVVEASAGLQPRTAAEAGEAHTSDEDIASTICGSGDGETVPIAAGATLDMAPTLPEQATTFLVTLSEAGGAYAGSVLYQVAEGGEYYIALSASGEASVTDSAGSEVEPEATVALSCSGLARAHVVELETGGVYAVALHGFDTDAATLQVAPVAVDHHHHHHDVDPHFWLDPISVQTYVENIRQALAEADPDGAAVYQANADAYTRELSDLDGWIREQVEQIAPERRLLVTNHENLGYFADRYGFTVVGAIVPSVTTGASPSAQQLASLVDAIREAGAPAVFLETGVNPQLAEQLAAETGVKVVSGLYTHSVGAEGDEVGSYIGMMRYNVGAIVAALR